MCNGFCIISPSFHSSHLCTMVGFALGFLPLYLWCNMQPHALKLHMMGIRSALPIALRRTQSRNAWNYRNCAIFSVLLVCENPRFSEFVIFQILRLLRFLDFRIFWFLHWSMRGCFGFLMFWVSRCSGCKDFRELWISRFLGSWMLMILGFLPFGISSFSG